MPARTAIVILNWNGEKFIRQFLPTLVENTNPDLARRKQNWIDFSAGQLIEGRTMQELVPEFIDKVLAVASGEQARNEANDYREISIFKNGVTL